MKMRLLCSVVCAAGCSVEPRVALDATLIGFNHIQVTDQGPRFGFRDRANPYVRIAKGECASPTLAWEPGDPWKLSSSRGLLRGTAPAVPSHLTGLTLRCAGRSAVQWRADALDDSTVTPIVELRRKKDFAEAQALLDQRLAGSGDFDRIMLLEEAAVLEQVSGKDPIRAWHRLADAAREARILTAESGALRAAAYHHFTQKELAEADALLERAHAIDAEINNVSGVVRVAYYRGLVLKERGRLHAATEAIRRGLTLAESYGLDRETAALRRQLASRLQDQGLHAEALAELESAAAYHRASSRPQDRMWFAIDLGWVLGRGMVAGAIPVDWPRVDTAWQEALGLADEIQATEARASIQSNLAWLDLQQDRPKRALERMETLADDDSRVGAFVGLLRAEATLAGGDAESAAQMFTRVSDRRPSEWGWRVQHGLGRAQEALGRPEEAARAYRHAIDQLEFLGRSTGLVSTRGPYFANSNALIDDALRLAVAEGKGDEALLIVESARTRVLAELNHQLRQDAMSDDEHREWRAARDTLHRLSAEIDTQTAARSTVSSSALAAFDRKLNSLHERYRRFLDKTVTRFSPEPRPLAPVAELLRPEEKVWITHRVGEGILHLLASQQTVHAGWQAPRTEADGHLFLMGDKAIERFATLSPTRSVSVIPTLRVLEAPAPSSGTGAAVFADPRGDLPHARREGKAVSAKLGASLHLGPDISRRELQRALDEHEIVHFAGHVQAGETGAWNSRLELNPVETLSLADIIVSPVRARLVVVNGCYASSGDFLHRSERIGLAEALLISGAKTVLTAGGQVPDDHARRFLEQFYENGGDRNPALAFATTAKETKGSGFVLWGRP